MDELHQRLAEPFDPKEIDWKAQTTNQEKTRALAVAYITARAVMDRLDEAVGLANWQDRYDFLPGGTVCCTLSLKIDDQWVGKADVGGQSDQPDAGDKAKSAVSDALKRAAVKWGVGRYLYNLPAVWVDYDAKKKQLAQVPPLPDWARPTKRNNNQPPADNRTPRAAATQVEQLRKALAEAFPDPEALQRANALLRDEFNVKSAQELAAAQVADALRFVAGGALRDAVTAAKAKEKQRASA